MQNLDIKINRLFTLWLRFSMILVLSIIIVGGLTRLTNSGLSITEWELFTGILPPLNDITWNNYFDLYKKIPQYQLLNSSMTMDEFKVIFYWEYFHRILARIIGLFILIPLIFFYLTKEINKEYLKKSLIIFLLVLIQGLVGWYMVKSGLVNDVSVSHYRLSLHLINAFIIISMIYWLLLNFKKNTNKIFFNFSKFNFPFLILFSLVFLQIIFGAFVSGLDAGKIYQTWPLMDKSYFPNDLILYSLINLLDFDNHSLVQFYHRNLAYIITLYILIMCFLILKKKNKYLYKPVFISLFFLLLQVFLGVLTLVSGLNIYLASAHQLTSVVLTLSLINLYYRYIN